MSKTCKVEGCDRTAVCRGLCNMHYRRMLKHGSPEHLGTRRKQPYVCVVAGCTRNDVTAHGYCHMHYLRYRVYGDPLGLPVNYLGCNSVHKRAYTSFNNMKHRCYNKNNKSYNNYGGRGIYVCKRWLCPKEGFRNFLEDMGDPPEECSLDRIDVNGPYSPENCRWATIHQQAANKQNSREHTGVWKDGAKWHARIVVDGVEHQIDTNTKEGAIQARIKLEKQFLGNYGSSRAITSS